MLQLNLPQVPVFQHCQPVLVTHSVGGGATYKLLQTGQGSNIKNTKLEGTRIFKTLNWRDTTVEGHEISRNDTSPQIKG